MAIERKFPTEVIDLPSKGWYYKEGSQLASGKIELKYMTAKEEDILTSRNLIIKGVVFDRLLQSLIVDKNIDYSTLLTGDKNGIMIASRILAYGKDYNVKVRCKECSNTTDTVVDLTSLEEKDVPKPEKQGENSFTFTLPNSGHILTFKLLTQKDQDEIDAELRGLAKIGSDVDSTVSTRLKYIITAVNGEEDKKRIREFVDNEFLTRDARAFREHYNSVNPDVDITFTFVCNSCGVERSATMPIGIEFFWPDSGV